MNDKFPPLPLYVDISKGLDEIRDHKNSREYITSLMRVFIRDTPFRQTQVGDLHEKIQYVDPTTSSYATSTIKRQLLRMRKDGLILLFEDHEDDLPSNRLFLWAESVPSLTQKEETSPKEVETRTIHKERPSTKVSSHENPATPFFKNLFKKVLGLS